MQNEALPFLPKKVTLIDQIDLANMDFLCLLIITFPTMGHLSCPQFDPQSSKLGGNPMDYIQ